MEKQIWATGQNWIMSEIFKNKNGQEQLVSFDLTDLIMSLVKRARLNIYIISRSPLEQNIF